MDVNQLTPCLSYIHLDDYYSLPLAKVEFDFTQFSEEYYALHINLKKNLGNLTTNCGKLTSIGVSFNKWPLYFPHKMFVSNNKRVDKFMGDSLDFQFLYHNL